MPAPSCRSTPSLPPERAAYPATPCRTCNVRGEAERGVQLLVHGGNCGPYRRRIQVVVQDPGSALDPRLTVRDCIGEGMDAFGIGSNYQERTERVASLMGKVSLDPATMWHYPHEFSGGRRQRIGLP